MTYVRIGLRRSGKFLQMIFCLCEYSFSPFRLFFPCVDVLSSCGDFLGSPAPRGFTFFSLPPFRRAGGGGGGFSGCPCVASRGSSSPTARLLCSERGGGTSGRSFGAHELASVSSVHSWAGGPGVALLRRNLLPALSQLTLSPLSN